MKLVTFATNRKEIDVGTTHPCSKHIPAASTSRHQGTWGQHIAASRQTLPGIGVIHTSGNQLWSSNVWWSHDRNVSKNRHRRYVSVIVIIGSFFLKGIWSKKCAGEGSRKTRWRWRNCKCVRERQLKHMNAGSKAHYLTEPRVWRCDHKSNNVQRYPTGQDRVPGAKPLNDQSALGLGMRVRAIVRP